MSARRLAGLAAFALCVAGCARASEPVRSVPPTTVQWRALRAELGALAAAYGPDRPYTMNVGLELSEPLSGRQLRARGAVAVSPEAGAVRMVLLGPGGATALDLWVCGADYRFELPAVDLVRRGDRRTPPAERRGLPVDFLSWWLLRPLRGQLLWAGHDAGGARRFVLRDGAAVVDARGGATGSLWVERRWAGERERVASAGPGCGEVRYHQESTGIDIVVHCERLASEREPSPKAFADPDDPARGCVARGAITR